MIRTHLAILTLLLGVNVKGSNFTEDTIENQIEITGAEGKLINLDGDEGTAEPDNTGSGTAEPDEGEADDEKDQG